MTDDMLELLRMLEKHGVRYLVIGGVAVKTAANRPQDVAGWPDALG